MIKKLSRRSLLASALVSAATARPNILLLITDQQSYQAFSAAGNPWLSTPAIDSLAVAGTVCTETICTYPVCSPSRSSIFTSRLPHETGVMGNKGSIASGIPTMGELFRAGGYRTVFGGKWHLPKTFEPPPGFDEYLIGGHALGEKMDAPLADACVKWLRANADPKPFLMVASFMNPHDICDWIRQHKGARTHSESARKRYPAAPLNLADDPASEPDCVRYHRRAGYDLMSEAVGIASEWHREDFRQYLQDYYRMVETVDGHVGRVLAAVDLTNTIVCFISDHGEGLGAHRWVQKAAFWEEVVRVPMIFRGAGIRAGSRLESLTTLNDVLPTLCDFAGVKPPQVMRGHSLRKALTGAADAENREFVTSELQYGSAEREGRMLRTARYKYTVFNSGSAREQFFDLEIDPGEIRNLIASTDHQGELARHRDLLRAYARETGDSRFVKA